jgi:hypothetical protein
MGMGMIRKGRMILTSRSSWPRSLRSGEAGPTLSRARLGRATHLPRGTEPGPAALGSGHGR